MEDYEDTVNDGEEEEDASGAKVDDIVDGSSKRKIVRDERKHRIFVIHTGGKDFSKISDSATMTSLPHPKLSKNARYMVLEDSRLLEIQRAMQQPSSWFIDDFVQRDGSLFLGTPVDPLFILVKLLTKNRKKTADHAGVFSEISQILVDTTNTSGFKHLHKFIEHTQLALVCDVREIEGNDPLYRLNDDKLLKWLRCKVDRLVSHLATLDPTSAMTAAQVGSFKASAKPVTKEELTRTAIGFVSEYVADQATIQKLGESYGISNFGVVKMSALDSLVPAVGQQLQQHSHSQSDNSSVMKRKNTDSDDKTPKKPKLTVAQSKLAKVNTKGMNKLTSFFTAAPKKEGNK